MNVQHLEVYSGENRTFTLYARDSSNVPVSLTGKTITWYVGVRPNDPANVSAVFTKTGTITVAASGIFTVSVSAADTGSLEGDYQHQATTTDGSGKVAVVCVGRLRIIRDITV